MIARFAALVLLLSGARSLAAQSTTSTVEAPETAAVEDSGAKTAFAAGRAAYDAGNYEEALQRFQEAHDLSKRPELLYNIGLAADRLRYNHAAREAYRAYVRQLPVADNR